ncbi:MAG: hypothetical protein J2P36_02130 [Ktedonobacteraceae bacterium]|nr:hypothetical protein [Ktedonobacteraceae bacterium]
MLENLDRVPWHRLTHAYGKANDVPALIKALASPQRETWEQALNELYQIIWHQYTVYQATSFAVPFFIELLQHEVTQCRAELLLFLSDLAIGCSDDKKWTKHTQDAVAQGFAVYLQLLKDVNPKVRMQVPYIIGTLRTIGALEGYTQTIFSLFHTFLRQEKDPQVQASLLMYLGYQAELPVDERLFMNLAYAEDVYPLVKVVAAMRHVERTTISTPNDTVQVLLDMLLRVDTLQKMYADLPWPHNHYSLLGEISFALRRLDFDYADRVIPVLIETLNSIDQAYRKGKIAEEQDVATLNGEWMAYSVLPDFGTIELLQTLFHFTFQGKKLAKNAVPFLLTKVQRTVLITVLRSEAALEYRHHVVEMLESLNLPYYWKLRILLQLDSLT